MKKAIVTVLLFNIFFLFGCRKVETFERVEFGNYGNENNGACGIVIINKDNYITLKPVSVPDDIVTSDISDNEYWVKLKYLNRVSSCTEDDVLIEYEPGNIPPTVEIEEVEIIEYSLIE